MDSKGHLYQEQLNGLFKKDADGKEVERKKSMIPLTERQYGEAKGMNRAERRKWYRENKK